MANILATMAKAMVKGKLGIGELNGLERYMLAQISIPDRVPTFLSATNVEPYLIDKSYDYVRLTQNPEANLELYKILKARFPRFDLMLAPVWMGLLFTGAAELGVKFEIKPDRVPYACDHVINSIEDVKKIEPLAEPKGFFKIYLDTMREAQQQLADTMVTYTNDGPWDLAMLLRGDQNLPTDFRLYKDYITTEDPVRKERIKRRGDPDLWPAIMEMTSEVTIQNFKLAKAAGVNMFGAIMIDQFATKPVLGTEDFIKYVFPYIKRVQDAIGFSVGMGFMVQTPGELEALSNHPSLGKALEMAGHTNYIFHQTPDGVTRSEYDRPMFELAKAHKKGYNYQIHGKFLRDATKDQLTKVVKRICEMAIEMNARLTIGLVSVPPGTDFENIDHLLDLVEEYGRY